ncbi:MAG TPA: hypothetical protein VLV83_24735 [Acidobacteriota bacterium]|nr:hypothetical protein [Acidobacteriota bacterium]
MGFGAALFGLAISAFLAASLLVLTRKRFLNSSSPDPATFSESHLNAEQILLQMSSRTHRVCQRDEAYNRALFRRYGQLLWSDLRRLAATGSLPAVACLLVFGIWYMVLSTGLGYRLFGVQSNALRILLGSMSPALRAPVAHRSRH